MILKIATENKTRLDNISNNNIVTALKSTVITLKCIQYSIPNNQTVWLYSSNGTDLYIIDNTQQSKFLIDNQFDLTIYNLMNSDEGYYSCGIVDDNKINFKSYYAYSLFVERKYEKRKL